LRSDHILVKFWSLVIFDFILLIFLFPFPLVSKLFLGPVKRVIVSVNILIFSEVWYKVIFWVSIIVWMKVLSAALTVADWVALLLSLHEPVVLWKIPRTMFRNRLFQVAKGVGDIFIHTKVWHEVVSWWVLRGILLPVPFVTEHGFSGVKRGIGMDTIVVFTVIWDSIVNWVIIFLFWVLILVATRRGANWVILNLNK